jgi:tetratricopeptide (TPR) repeat protein
LVAQTLAFHDPEASAPAAHAAIDHLEPVARETDDDAEMALALVEAAWAHSAVGQYERAIELCLLHRRSGHEPRSRLHAMMILAEALRGVGRLDEAAEAVAEALRLSIEDPLTRPALFVTSGLIARDRADDAAAKRAFEAAAGVLREQPPEHRDREAAKAIYGNLAEVACAAGEARPSCPRSRIRSRPSFSEASSSAPRGRWWAR